MIANEFGQASLSCKARLLGTIDRRDVGAARASFGVRLSAVAGASTSSLGIAWLDTFGSEWLVYAGAGAGGDTVPKVQSLFLRLSPGAVPRRGRNVCGAFSRSGERQIFS